jgi:hypothetical protein
VSDDIATIDYVIRDLMNTNNTITAVTLLSLEGTVVYQTSNWDISPDIIQVLNAWRQQSPSVVVQGIKYSTLQCTPERLVSTNILGQGHIVASSERDRILLAYVTPDGGAGIAYMDVARTLTQITGGGVGGAMAQTSAPMDQPPYSPQQYQQQQQLYPEPTYSEQDTMRPVPKSTWATTTPDADMKNIIWEVEEFRKYVERGDFALFLRDLLTQGDQVKIWEVLKLIRHFKSLSP